MTDNIQNTEQRFYNDTFNDVTVEFFSDASQKTIDALSFNGDWYTVRGILLDWGYKIIENININ